MDCSNNTNDMFKESADDLTNMNQVLSKFIKNIKLEDNDFKDLNHESLKCENDTKFNPIHNSLEYNTAAKHFETEMCVNNFNLDCGKKLGEINFELGWSHEKIPLPVDVDLERLSEYKNTETEKSPTNGNDTLLHDSKKPDATSTLKTVEVEKVNFFNICEQPNYDNKNILIMGSEMKEITGQHITNSQDGPQSESRKLLSWPSGLWEDGSRRSAFHPYKPATVLTNLQRGNIQAKTQHLDVTLFTWHMKSGRGDLRMEDFINVFNIDEKDDYGMTALMWSAAYGQATTVQRLLERGSDPMIRGKTQQTALHLAACGGHHEIIKLLLNFGADVNVMDEDWNTPIMYAVAEDHPHAVHELLMGEADITIANRYNIMPYKLAIENDCSSAQIVIENHIISLINSKLS